MLSFHKRLSHVKRKLKECNKVHFKNIFEESAWIENKLRTLNEIVIERGMREEEFLKEKALKVEKVDIMAREVCFWRQKSREVWLNE